MCLADDRHGIEVEIIEGFSNRQVGIEQMAFDASPFAIGEFMLGEGGQEARGWPAFLVGLGGEIGP